MRSRLSRILLIGVGLLFAFALAACSGGNSGAEEPEVALVAQSFNEGCTLCHAPGKIVDVATAHSLESNSRQGKITGVSIAAGKITVAFKLFDSLNNLIPLGGVSSSSIRFTIAKLSGGNWQSYINQIEDKAAGEPGTTPDGTTAIQATSETANKAGGLFTDNADGSYTYTFSFDITAVVANGTTIPLTVPYEPGVTHRIAMQVSGNVANPFVDFVPNDLPISIPPYINTGATRTIVANATCNECHIKLALHGGGRIQTEYCVTCHNPGSTDANSGNSVDFEVMIHKIHRGENLPAVEAGGEYAIWGYSNNKHDYSTVVYPQDIRNCTKCHDGADAATPDGDNWKNVPSTAACTSCHDAPDPVLYPTFPNLLAADIVTAHQIPAQIAAAKIKLNILNVSTAPGTAGALDVTIDFSVTDPTNGNLEYDIFDKTTVNLTPLSFLIGWNTDDYTNTKSGRTPAQPVSVSVSNAAYLIANTFTVTAKNAVPAGVTGSGVVGLQGHPLKDLDGDGQIDDNVPVKSVVKSFAITDTIAQDRRKIVDIVKCDQCHGVLSLHGSNRTDEPQLCVICHNADATDIEVRPDAATAVDGKVEEAIDFKYMIHAIHAGDIDEHGYRDNGIVVYGFRGSVNNYSHVRLPAGFDNLKNCNGCHVSGTAVVPLDEKALPTTIRTNADEASPDDDTNITPTAAVCSSCHDSIFAKTHMSEQGALFDFIPFRPAVPESGGGSEAALCGPGPVSAQPAGHTDRVDCCSCHSVQ